MLTLHSSVIYINHCTYSLLLAHSCHVSSSLFCVFLYLPGHSEQLELLNTQRTYAFNMFILYMFFFLFFWYYCFCLFITDQVPNTKTSSLYAKTYLATNLIPAVQYSVGVSQFQGCFLGDMGPSKSGPSSKARHDSFLAFGEHVMDQSRVCRCVSMKRSHNFSPEHQNRPLVEPNDIAPLKCGHQGFFFCGF